MQENKISESEAKYFTKEQLQDFLERKFGTGLDFKIQVRLFLLMSWVLLATADGAQNISYRWKFWAPAKVEKVSWIYFLFMR